MVDGEMDGSLDAHTSMETQENTGGNGDTN